jgi:hypothetical protein
MPRHLVMLASPLITCALAFAASARAQEKRDATPRTSQATTKRGANAKRAADAARSRRDALEALAALREVAEAARSFDDLYESVSTQANVAYVLWPHDEQTARAILRRAWEAATAPGAEGKARGLGTFEDPREDAREALTAARRRVVTVALKYDPRLADAFMREFERTLGDDAPAPRYDEERVDATLPQRRERGLSQAGWQRIFIARDLFALGDFKRAAEAVAPLVAEGVTQPLLSFILDFRAGDANTADALYMRLLERMRAAPGADANDVLLLSTPVVSPNLWVAVGESGSVNLASVYYATDAGRSAASALPPEVRRAFFVAAASVLLRASASGGGQPDDKAALYFAVARLLPSFEREAAQFAPALHSRLNALAADIEASRRDSLTSSTNIRGMSVGNPRDPFAFLPDEIAGASNAAERDFVRLRAVTLAARRGIWNRAREVAAEIEGAQAQREALRAIAIRQVMDAARAFGDDEGDAFVRATDFVRAADVPHEVRAAGLAQAAELASRRGKRALADELFTEAIGYANQSERGEKRVTALALITLSAARADSMRVVRELLPALVRASDETDELPFGALNLEFTFGAEGNRLSLFALDAPVNLADVFAAAARLDPLRTFTEARAFKDEELRAEALLYAARAVLDKSLPGRVADAGRAFAAGQEMTDNRAVR